jgi:hypothetical protein
VSDPYFQQHPPSPYAPPAYPPVDGPQPSPSPVPYASAYTTATPGLPASVKAIGICGICLGALSLSCNAILLAMFLLAKRSVAYGPRFITVKVIDSSVFAVTATVLLVGSVGCLLRLGWARTLLVAWAVAYALLVIVAAVVSLGYVIPSLVAGPMLAEPNGQQRLIGAYASGIVPPLLELILPVFVLVFLRSPSVRAAFHPGRVGRAGAG